MIDDWEYIDIILIICFFYYNYQNYNVKIF